MLTSSLLRISGRLVFRKFSQRSMTKLSTPTRSSTTTLSTPTRSSTTTTLSTPIRSSTTTTLSTPTSNSTITALTTRSSTITELSIPLKREPISSLISNLAGRLNPRVTGVVGGLLGGFSFFTAIRDFSSRSFSTQKERIKDVVDWRQFDMVTPTVPWSSAPFRPIKQGLYSRLTPKVGLGCIAELGGFSSIKSTRDFSSRSLYTSSVSSRKDDCYSVPEVSCTADEVGLIRETFLDFDKDQGSEDMLGQVMELTFTEAAKGVNKDISVDYFDSCPRCGGTGHHLGTKFYECSQCDCSGTSSLCLLCKGKGQTRQLGTVSVAVPAGVEDGLSARMPVGKKMNKVTFSVEESPLFRRHGADVHSDVVISEVDAKLGGTAQAQGLYGTIDIPIPPGTQADQNIRLAGKGFAHIHNYSFGDHYVHIKIREPRNIELEY